MSTDRGSNFPADAAAFEWAHGEPDDQPARFDRSPYGCEDMPTRAEIEAEAHR
ncbi:MAG: hypothetical protein ACR2JO_07920 [Mycobacteriales bacterium]